MADTTAGRQGPEEPGPDGDPGEHDQLTENLVYLHLADNTSATQSYLAEEIQAIADAATTEMPLGTKVDVLAALARKDFPGGFLPGGEGSAYDNLAAVIAPKLAPDQVLADFRLAVDDPAAFANTPTGQQLEPHHYAFLGDGCVCQTAMVTVDGRQAAWIYGEFNTDAPWQQCRKWIDPENWPRHSPSLFKKMQPKDQLRPQGTASRWHSSYMETVALPRRVQTSLRFDYAEEEDDGFVGLSYTLDNNSQPVGDGVIDVDRGFISINDLGEYRHIKTLKIVGFADLPHLNTMATKVCCPLWSEFAKGAVAGSTMSICASEPSDSLAELNEYVMASATENIEIGEEWARAALSRKYGYDKLARDSAGAWVKLAHDWTNLWSRSYTAVESLAATSPILRMPPRDSLPQEVRVSRHRWEPLTDYVGSVRPAGTDGVETMVVPVAGLRANSRTRLDGDFVGLGGELGVIPAGDIDHQVVTLGQGVQGVLLRVATRSLGDGIYCGRMRYSSGVGDGEAVAPVHFYVSRASRA